MEWTAVLAKESGLIYAAGRDVTDQKAAERALREADFVLNTALVGGHEPEASAVVAARIATAPLDRCPRLTAVAPADVDGAGSVDGQRIPSTLRRRRRCRCVAGRRCGRPGVRDVRRRPARRRRRRRRPGRPRARPARGRRTRARGTPPAGPPPRRRQMARSAGAALRRAQARTPPIPRPRDRHGSGRTSGGLRRPRPGHLLRLQHRRCGAAPRDRDQGRRSHGRG